MSRLCFRSDWSYSGVRGFKWPIPVAFSSELVDFLNLAGHNTYACFKMKEQNKAYFMYIATEATKNKFPLAYLGLQ